MPARWRHWPCAVQGSAAPCARRVLNAADGAGAMLVIAPSGLMALTILGADRALCALGQPIRNMALSVASPATADEWQK